MTHPPRHFTAVDPRTFDGDPFEVAQRAALQAHGIALLLVETVASAIVMARNAELERQLQDGNDADPAAWEASAQGRRFAGIQQDTKNTATALALLARAAGFNPKNPPKE